MKNQAQRHSAFSAATRGASIAVSCAAVASLLAACGGLKTNPTEGYKDLGGVRPYAATPDNRQATVRLSQVFKVEFADANQQALGARPLAFEAGKETVYFVRSEVKLRGQAQPHALVASGLPAGVALSAVEGTPGLYRLGGTPAARALACGPQQAAEAKIRFSWELAPTAPADVQASARSEIGQDDMLFDKAYAFGQQTAPARMAADDRLQREIAAGEAFSIRIEGLTTTSQFPPLLAIEGTDAIEFAGGNRSARALNAEGTAWEWSLQAKAGTSAREIRFGVAATNSCDGQTTRIEGLVAKLAGAPVPAVPQN